MTKIIEDTGSSVLKDIVNQFNDSNDTNSRNYRIDPTTSGSHTLLVLGPKQKAVFKDLVLAIDGTGLNLQNIMFGIASLNRGYWETQPYPVDADVIFRKAGFTTNPLIGGEITSIKNLRADVTEGNFPFTITGPCQVRLFFENNEADGFILKMSTFLKAITDEVILEPEG